MKTLIASSASRLMTRKSVLSTIVILTGIVLITLWQSSVSAKNPTPGFLGLQAAGTYIMDIEIVSPPGFDPSVSLITFNASGGYTVTDTRAFGQGELAANGFRSPEHGAWKRTGPREISTKSFVLTYNAEGERSTVFRISSTLTFDRDYMSFSGPFVVELLDPLEDPLEGEAGPVTVQGVIVQGRRVVVD